MRALVRTNRSSVAIRTVFRGALVVLGLAVVLGYALEVAVGLIALTGAGVLLELFRRRPTFTVVMVWVITVFEPAAGSVLPDPLGGLAKTLDEPLILLLFVGTFVHTYRTRPPARVYVLLPVAGFLLAGWMSGFLNMVPFAPLALGTWQGAKFWTLLFVTVHVPWRRADVALLVRAFTGVTVVVMSLAVIELVAPGPLQTVLPVTAEGAEARFGRTGLQSLFTHPGHFGSFATFFSVFFLARFVHTGNRTNLALAVWCIGLGLLSLRFKVILGFVGALAALAVVGPQRFVRRLGALVLVLIVAVSVGGGIITDLAQTQIDRYLFSEGETVRGALYRTSTEIGVDNFPFGEGFGRFGTGAATQFSSPVYDEYGLGERRGLSDEVPGVRYDTTWPTVLGESGYLGMFCYLGGVVAIWLRLLRQAWSTDDPELRWLSAAAVAVLTNVLLESLGRPSFFTAITSMATALVIVPPLVIGMRGSDPALSEPSRAMPDRTERDGERGRRSRVRTLARRRAAPRH